MLTRDQILSADDRPRQTVPVPEWGGDVVIRTMSGAERTRYEEWLLRPREGETFARARALLAALTIVDESGNLIFSQADVEQLDAKSCAALDRVFEASMKLNRLRKQDLEDLEKNSGSSPAAASSTDSPATSAAPAASC
jgi:hypothetical protein